MNWWVFKPKLREIEKLVPVEVFEKIEEYFRDRTVTLSFKEKLESVMDFVRKREWEG